MGIFSLQLLCPSSSSPIQTASDCSLHRDQNFPEKMSLRNGHWFVPNIHASQPSSCHHSIREHSSHHQTWNRQWKNRPHDTIVQILCVCELVSVSGGFTDQMNQCSTFFPCANFSHSWNLWIVLLDCQSPLFSLLFPLSALLDHDLLCCLSCHCLCVG